MGIRVIRSEVRCCQCWSTAGRCGVCNALSSRPALPTRFPPGRSDAIYESLEAGRAVVAPPVASFHAGGMLSPDKGFHFEAVDRALAWRATEVGSFRVPSGFLMSISQAANLGRTSFVATRMRKRVLRIDTVFVACPTATVSVRREPERRVSRALCTRAERNGALRAAHGTGAGRRSAVPHWVESESR